MQKILISIITILITAPLYGQMTTQGNLALSESIDIAQVTTYSKTLTFKNTASIAQSINTITGSDANKFKIATNRCVNIAAGKTCSLTITSQRGITARINPYQITVSGVNINLTVTKAGQSTTNQLVSSLSISSPVDLKNVMVDYREKSKTVIIEIKNTGDYLETPIFSLINTANQLDVSIALNRCTGSISPKKSCSVTLKINDPQSYSQKQKNFKVEANGQILAQDFILASRLPLSLNPLIISNEQAIREDQTIDYNIAHLIKGGKPPYSVSFTNGSSMSLEINNLTVSPHYEGSDLTYEEIVTETGTLHVTDGDGNEASAVVNISFKGVTDFNPVNLEIVASYPYAENYNAITYKVVEIGTNTTIVPQTTSSDNVNLNLAPSGNFRLLINANINTINPLTRLKPLKIITAFGDYDDGIETYCDPVVISGIPIYSCLLNYNDPNNTPENVKKYTIVIPEFTVSGSIIMGCLDPLAANYNSAANFNNGSCSYIFPTPTFTVTYGSGDQEIGISLKLRGSNGPEFDQLGNMSNLISGVIRCGNFETPIMRAFGNIYSQDDESEPTMLIGNNLVSQNYETFEFFIEAEKFSSTGSEIYAWFTESFIVIHCLNIYHSESKLPNYIIMQKSN